MSNIDTAAWALPAPVANVILLDRGFKENAGDRGPGAVVRYLVHYADRWTFAQYCVGTSFGASPNTQRTIPASYPPYPKLYGLEVLEIGPIGKPTNVNGQLVTTHAYVDVRFGIPPYRFDGSDPSGVPWTATTATIGAELVPLPTSVYAFPNGVRTQLNPQLYLPTAEIQVYRRWLGFWPLPILLTQGGGPGGTFFGTVNNGAFLGCATGTLLFLGAEPTVTTDTIGNYVYDVNYRFSWRYQVWNAELNPDGVSGWQTITDGNGALRYASSDFTQLP
jgi:hypothetical protein